MINDNFASTNDLNIKHNEFSDSEVVTCYVRKLNDIFHSYGVRTNNSYDFCVKSNDLFFEYTNRSMIDSLFDTEAIYISRFIISELNQYIEQDLGIKTTKDELIKMEDSLFSDNINKAILGNEVKVTLSDKIDDMYHNGILYGKKYYLIKEFNIAINVIDCRLINRIIGNDGIDIAHYLYFKYTFSFDTNLKNNVLCIISE